MNCLSKTYFLSLISLISIVTAQSRVTGNCVSGRYSFDPSRITNAPIDSVDPAAYDWVIVSNPSNAVFNSNGVELHVSKNPNGGPGNGVTLISTRYFHYANIKLQMEASTAPGVVTSIYTISDLGDKIAWDMTGSDPSRAQLNAVYRGLEEPFAHNHNISIPGGIGTSHSFAIDWRSRVVTFLVNGGSQHAFSTSGNTSPLIPPGQVWYPDTPARLVLSVWDAATVTDTYQRSFVGGPISWNSNVSFKSSIQFIDIQCFGYQDAFVSSYPDGTLGSINFPSSTNIVNGACPKGNCNVSVSSMTTTSPSSKVSISPKTSSENNGNDTSGVFTPNNTSENSAQILILGYIVSMLMFMIILI